MVSPAKAHFLRQSAAALGVAERPQDTATANAYELMLMKLAEDRRRLKDVQSIERKADVKRILLPEYQPWIQGVLAGDSGQQDDVFMSVLVWTVDIGAIAAALPLVAYAIRHQLVLPDQYKRTTACLIAEEAADIALKTGDVEHLAALQEVESLVAGEDMPDEVRAKLHKAIGYAIRTAAGWKQDTDYKPDATQREGLIAAKQHLERALALHAKAGTKKDIERLATLIKNSAPAAVDAENTANPDPNG